MGIVLDIMDGPLCNSILKMNIDATVRDELLVCLIVRDEIIISKMAIVTVVLLNVDRVSCRKFLKCFLAFNDFSRAKSLVEMDISQAREVVNKYGGCFASISSQPSFELSNKSILRILELVN